MATTSAYALDLDDCELCDTPVPYLYLRVDNTDGVEVWTCERCANTGDVGYCED